MKPFLNITLAVLISFFSQEVLALDIYPDDPKLQYMGRWDFSNSKAPQTSWGHSLKACFTGTSISIKTNQTGSNGIYYEYSIDDAPFKTVSGSGSMTFSLATGLPAGSHSLVFRRRLEASYGMSTIEGLVIDDGALLEMPNARSALQLEFIGDSITAGFGSEAAQSVTTNNINVTWAARLADKLGADRATIARSGIGISIDVNGSELSMPKRYADTHFSWGGSSPAWNFSNQIPNAVFILLGTNDYVFGSPTASEFEAAYTTFIQTVRGHYPVADIFVVNLVQGRTTPAAKWDQASTSLEKVVDDLHAAGEMRVHFVDPGEGLVGADFSDTTHPLPSGHEKMANNLYQLVQPMIGSGEARPPLPSSSPVAAETEPTSNLQAPTEPVSRETPNGEMATAPAAEPAFVDANGAPQEAATYDANGNAYDAFGNPLTPVAVPAKVLSETSAPDAGGCSMRAEQANASLLSVLSFFCMIGLMLRPCFASASTKA